MGGVNSISYGKTPKFRSEQMSQKKTHTWSHAGSVLRVPVPVCALGPVLVVALAAESTPASVAKSALAPALASAPVLACAPVSTPTHTVTPTPAPASASAHVPAVVVAPTTRLRRALLLIVVGVVVTVIIIIIILVVVVVVVVVVAVRQEQRSFSSPASPKDMVIILRQKLNPLVSIHQTVLDKVETILGLIMSGLLLVMAGDQAVEF